MKGALKKGENFFFSFSNKKKSQQNVVAFKQQLQKKDLEEG